MCLRGGVSLWRPIPLQPRYTPAASWRMEYAQ